MIAPKMTSQFHSWWSYLGQSVHDADLLSLGLPKVVKIEGADPEV